MFLLQPEVLQCPLKGKRSMKKSFFTRYYYLCTTFLVISILLVGTFVLIAANQLYRNERYEKINGIVKTVISNVSSSYSNYSEIDSDNVHSQLENFSRTYNISFFIFDSDGNYLASSDSNNSNYEHANFSNAFLNKYDNDVYFKIGYINGITEELSACYVSGFTVSRNNVPDSEKSFYMLATSSAVDINNFFKSLFIFFAISSILITLIASLLYYNTAKRMIAPFTKISETAENFIKGDYTKQLPVDDTEEFSRLAMSFNEMASTIAKNETTHKNFIANISHELRTPMTTIGGFIDGILDGTIPQNEQKHYMTLVSEEIKRLSRLVKTMLNISKFEANEMSINYENVNITEIAIKTILMFEKKIEEKHVEINGLDCPRIVLDADRDLLQQLFYNIIENAVKFVNEKGVITFIISQTENNAVISIKNTGEGLSEEEIPKIFTRFYKTDESRSADASGIGLGLSIVRSIINLHNGTITVKSIKGEYTEFIIELPLSRGE